jgi:hypothetical protein
MDIKYIINSALLFTLGQCIVWIQVNGPILWPWAKTWQWALALLGIPITYVFMKQQDLQFMDFKESFGLGDLCLLFLV